VAQGANQPAPTISTHVLDTGLGAPGVGIHVTLYRLSDDGRPLRLTQAMTDGDGRVRDLLERPLVAGKYRLEFDLAPRAGDESAIVDRFFQRVSVDLLVSDVSRSHHVPVLLSPYSLTSYRGS
jgi:5-hydroxyisourate hydrolase